MTRLPFKTSLSLFLIVSLCFCLSVCLYVCLSVCLSVCLPVCLSVYLPLSFSLSFSLSLSLCLSFPHFSLPLNTLTLLYYSTLLYTIHPFLSPSSFRFSFNWPSDSLLKHDQPISLYLLSSFNSFSLILDLLISFVLSVSLSPIASHSETKKKKEVDLKRIADIERWADHALISCLKVSWRRIGKKKERGKDV